jgi:gamma-glutamylaminecyclotransferase
MDGYPALVAGGTAAVRGEVYEVEESLIPELDAYEDVPELYQRVTLEIGGIEAFVYLLPEAFAVGRPELPSGDWRDHAP